LLEAYLQPTFFLFSYSQPTFIYFHLQNHQSIFKMKSSILASILAVAASVSATPTSKNPDNFHAIAKRASFPIPASKGSVTYKATQKITGTFDGGMKTYGRGVSCTGQSEGGDSDAVFILADGATLKNVIIGKDQIEGVHCSGACTIENVWWSSVCEGEFLLQYIKGEHR
jgi:hypothetical protein